LRWKRPLTLYLNAAPQEGIVTMMTIGRLIPKYLGGFGYSAQQKNMLKYDDVVTRGLNMTTSRRGSWLRTGPSTPISKQSQG